MRSIMGSTRVPPGSPISCLMPATGARDEHSSIRHALVLHVSGGSRIESARLRRQRVTPVEHEQRTAARASEEGDLLRRLPAGDERAFESLVLTHHGTMLSIAGNYVRSRAVAEEVVQEAWLGVVNGLDRFEGRSSLRTWILKILVNTAMGRGTREARSVPFSSLAAADEHE